MASKTTKALVMKFTETVNNKVRQVKLTNPRADITDAEVQAFMELIVRLKPFYDLGPAGVSSDFCGLPTIRNLINAS